MEILNHLAGEIGDRFGGSDGAARAARYLADQFKALGMEVRLQAFRHVGWEQHGPTRFSLTAPASEELEANSLWLAESTPAEGLHGRVVRIGTAPLIPGLHEWPKYALVDDEGREIGQILARPHYRGGTFPGWDPAFFDLPGCMISGANGERIDAWLAEGKEVRATLVNRGAHQFWVTSYNVIAELPGETEDVIVVGAHYDTALGTTGAVDNASGVETVMRTARELAAQPRRKHTYRFIAFGSEEYNLYGSRYYVNDARIRGQLDKVKLMVNIDCVGAGDTFNVWVGPEKVQGQVDAVLTQIGLKDEYKVEYTQPLQGSDHWPFWQAGIPVIMFIVWPYDAYHLPEDNLSIIDPKLVDRATDATMGVLRLMER